MSNFSESVSFFKGEVTNRSERSAKAYLTRCYNEAKRHYAELHEQAKTGAKLYLGESIFRQQLACNAEMDAIIHVRRVSGFTNLKN